VTLSPEALWYFDIVALVAGAAYAVLAASRNRWCWTVGALSSACAAVVAGVRALPMQSVLQVIYVFISLYGWRSWTRSNAKDELTVGTWPLNNHLIAIVVLTGLSFAAARWLAAEMNSAWPLLDSATTCFSLFATWLAARARLENWLYWIVIDLVLVFLFYVQGSLPLALLNVLFIGIAVAGYVAWRRQFRAQAVPA
jgi:nicotinamide mononucleotide transporter